MASKKGNKYVIDEANNIAKIELNRKGKENLWTIIDLEDLEKVINFPYTKYTKYNHTNDEYYVVASVYHPELQQSRPIFLHQFLMNANGKDVDHKNNNTLDNRKFNMRVVEESNNSKNRKGRNKNNKSGYRNVSLINGKWVVQLQIDGKNKRLGKFDDVHEAGKFAEEMRQKYYGEFCGKG
mgnify:CR=1 FL=1